MVTAIECGGELIVGISEVLKAVLPQSHVLETTEGLFVRGDPIGRTKGHQKEEGADVGKDRTQYEGAWNETWEQLAISAI